MRSPEFPSNYIVFFGAACHVLIYNIEKDDWSTRRLNLDYDQQFKMFTSAVAVNNDRVLLIGGGFSGEVFEFDPRTQEVLFRHGLERIRTEHASVCLGGRVYIIGGYDKKENKFLSECEIYDPAGCKGLKMAGMRVPKCGFGLAHTSK